MQQFLWFRRLTLISAAVGALAVAQGACGGDLGGTDPGNDAGSSGGGNGGSFDMGFFPGDAGGDAVVLESPMPFQSKLTTDVTFQFRCNLATDTPVSLEPYVSIVSRQDGTMLSGAFNWKQTSAGVYQLNFLPAVMADDSDYVVTVKSPGANVGPKPIIFKTGISTGTHPQVVEAQLRSNNKAAEVYFTVRFSEEMDPITVESAFGVKMGGSAVAGTFKPVTDGSAPANTKFELDLPANPTIKTPIILVVQSSAQAKSGVYLDADSWDSPFNINGDFQWTAPITTPLDMAQSAVYSFAPTIN